MHQYDDGGGCPNCGSLVFEVDHNRGDIICADCGLVAPHSNLSDYFAPVTMAVSKPCKPVHTHHKPHVSNQVRAFLDRPAGKSAKYKHITYLREIWRLFRGQEPRIPDDDFALIEGACRRHFPHGATKDQLRGVLHNIDRFKRALGTRGYFVQKYLVSKCCSVCETIMHAGECVHGTL